MEIWKKKKQTIPTLTETVKKVARSMHRTDHEWNIKREKYYIILLSFFYDRVHQILQKHCVNRQCRIYPCTLYTIEIRNGFFFLLFAQNWFSMQAVRYRACVPRFCPRISCHSIFPMTFICIYTTWFYILCIRKKIVLVVCGGPPCAHCLSTDALWDTCRYFLGTMHASSITRTAIDCAYCVYGYWL